MSQNMFGDFSEFIPIFLTIGSTWWIWLPIILFGLLINLWLVYVQTKYKESIKWSLLEIRIPRELLRTPKSMEQILSGLYGLQLPRQPH